MSLSSVVSAMAASGCTPQQIADVVRAHEEEEKMAASVPPWAVQVRAVFERDGRVCRYCADEGGPFEVDHVLARSKGGTNELSNLVVACRACNRSKKDMDVEEYKSVAAIRQARYRAKRAQQKHNGGVTNVTPSVTPPIDNSLTPALSIEVKAAERDSDLESRCRLLAGELPVVADPSFSPVADLVGKNGITEADVLGGLKAALECSHRLKFWSKLEPWVRRAAKDRLAAAMAPANYARAGPPSSPPAQSRFTGDRDVRKSGSIAVASIAVKERYRLAVEAGEHPELPARGCN